MSDLQRRWARVKMEMRAGGRFDEAEEVAEEEAEGDSGRGLAEMPAPALSLGNPRKRPSLDPVSWTAYFSEELFLDADEGSGVVHHAYLTPPVFSRNGDDDGPLFVLHHGAGSSALSFSVLAGALRRQVPASGVLSVDARGHGQTRAPAPADMSLATLRDDLVRVVKLVQTESATAPWPRMPPLVLVGHSMGGAVVTEVAAHANDDGTGMAAAHGCDLLGYAVLDVVEGSALEALAFMDSYLATRPTGFVSVAAAIEWHVRTHTVRNLESARISVPPLLVEAEAPLTPPFAYRWRTDLGATRQFWDNWFRGLSHKFLTARGGKLLLLAGTDRLDTELMIGQMQGKYALQVLPEAGHFLHEDCPDRTAAVLADFYHRNNRTALVLPPKISELLAQGKTV